jgi:hypothetical protein
VHNNYSDIIPTLFKDYLSLDIFISKSNRLGAKAVPGRWPKLGRSSASRVKVGGAWDVFVNNLPEMVICYSLRTWSHGPFRNSWFTELEDGDFPVRKLLVHQRVSLKYQLLWSMNHTFPHIYLPTFTDILFS